MEVTSFRPDILTSYVTVPTSGVLSSRPFRKCKGPFNSKGYNYKQQSSMKFTCVPTLQMHAYNYS